MPRVPTEPWIVENDEFHPDPRVAAVFADQNARLFVRQVYRDELKRLSTKTVPLTADEGNRLTLFREYLREVEQEIADFNEKEDDE